MTVKANLKRLSFAAPENCVQKNGANRRWRISANWFGWAGGAGCTAAGAMVVFMFPSLDVSCLARLHARGAAAFARILYAIRSLLAECGQHRDRRAGADDMLQRVAGHHFGGEMENDVVPEFEALGH